MIDSFWSDDPGGGRPNGSEDRQLWGMDWERGSERVGVLAPP